MSNKDIVLNIIKKSSSNMTAYEILRKFQKIKNVQPMTVYRALNILIDDGVIHKSNINKTFIYCKQGHDHNHNPVIAICKKCGDTDELKSDLFINFFKKYSLKKFKFKNFELEVSTLCTTCTK